jgi:predicted AAA+ superfamily ATPase
VKELFLEYITYGAYPEVVLLDDNEKKKRKLELLTTDYIKKDIFEANISEINAFFGMLRVLASQT